MVEPPAPGRVFGLPMRPLLADCAPSGRIRLDALARWLQDVAYADIEDAGIESAAIWVVRRTRLLVQGFPRFGERLRVETFASGIGRMWAERRTTVRPLLVDAGAGENASSTSSARPLVEAVSLWIHLDPIRRVPAPLSEGELSVYREAAGNRRFSYRLGHPKPDQAEGLAESEWIFRRADLDLADHVNNAAYWEPLEEELLAGGRDPTVVDAEVEFRMPAQPGPVRMLRDGCYRWLTDPNSGEVYASMLLIDGFTTSAAVPR